MTYRVIVADPPWKVAAGRTIGRYEKQGDKQLFGVKDDAARKLAYPSMSVERIAALPIKTIVAPDAHLYLWVINKYLPHALKVIEAWGFEYSTALVWAKNPMGGGLGGAYGISTEFCLFCRRGSWPARDRIGTTWFNWKRPYKDGFPNHSAKPPEFLQMVERVSEGPYLELFARSKRPGWHAWGNEIESDIAI